MQISRAHRHSTISTTTIVLLDIQTHEQAVQILHIADIASEAHDGFGVEGFEAVYVGEAGEGAVGGEIIGCDDDAGCEFDGEDGGAGYDGRLGVRDGLVRGVGLREVVGVVGAVDVISGL